LSIWLLLVEVGVVRDSMAVAVERVATAAPYLENHLAVVHQQNHP